MAEKRRGHTWRTDFHYDEEDGLRWVECRVEGFDDWRIRAVVTRSETGLAITKLTVAPHGRRAPAGGIPAELLRRISTRDIYWAAQATLAEQSAGTGTWVTVEPPQVAGRGRRGYPLLHYAIWAERYVEALAEDSPVLALAARWHVSPASVRGYIHTARQKGLLTEAVNGRAGGILTDAAQQLLKEGARDGEH